jgi:hypothetical protein
MKKLIPLLFLFSSCYKDIDEWPNSPQTISKDEIKNYTLVIDSALDIYGTKSLPKDANGYYHMKLYENTNQTFSRIVGKILLNGKPPLEPKQYVEWESNLHWYINPGDTLMKITKSYINYYTGQFTIINLPPLISNTIALVKTTNTTSINSDNGIINNMIAPIYKMKGDTMILKASHIESKLVVYTKIILE